jgi:hypothetical protein
MIEPLPMMQLLIAENIPLSICFTAVEHRELWQLGCNLPEFPSMTWIADYPQACDELIGSNQSVRGLSTGIKHRSQSKSFQLCNCAVETAVGSLDGVPANRLFVLP